MKPRPIDEIPPSVVTDRPPSPLDRRLFSENPNLRRYLLSTIPELPELTNEQKLEERVEAITAYLEENKPVAELSPSEIKNEIQRILKLLGREDEEIVPQGGDTISPIEDKPLVRVTVPMGFIKGNTKERREVQNNSFELRKEMVLQSESWSCYRIEDVDDFQDDFQKVWTKSGLPVVGRQMWFGKPGKDWKKAGTGQDMRLSFVPVGTDPRNQPQLTFGQAVEPFSRMLRVLSEPEREEVFALLIRMRRPSLSLDHVRERGATGEVEVFWRPTGNSLERLIYLNQRVNSRLGPSGRDNRELIDMLGTFEGIARIEDLKYLKEDNKSRGRTNNISSMVVATNLRLQLDEEIAPPVMQLWKRFVQRMSVETSSIALLLSVLGMEDS